MRLWHQDLISKLPRPQLLGQHRECCALRGNGWGKKHATVNYVFDYSPYRLYAYHRLIMEEMTARGYKVSPQSGGSRPTEARPAQLIQSWKRKPCPPLSIPSIRTLTSKNA